VAWLRDLLGRMSGRPSAEAAPAQLTLPPVPTSDQLLADVTSIEGEVLEAARSGRVSPVVAARVSAICGTARQTIPRLDALGGAGSRDGHSVMSTVTSYLPEALGTYLRLPREFADRRPISGNKTSLMVLVDQLDLLDRTMHDFLDAAVRQDAAALVAHGAFLADKFGHSGLDVTGLSLGDPAGGPA
jgi:hypothetical protein